MKKKDFKVSRRQILKAGFYGGAGMMLPLRFLPAKAFADPAAFGLSDPALQPKFVEFAPNALDPGFLFKDLNENGGPAQRPNFSLRAGQAVQETGLINPKNGRRLKTTIWGYGSDTVTWPGQTIQVMSTSAGGADETVVRWENELQGKKHLLPVDTSLHWCYSLHGPSSATVSITDSLASKKTGCRSSPISTAETANSSSTATRSFSTAPMENSEGSPMGFCAWWLYQYVPLQQ